MGKSTYTSLRDGFFHLAPLVIVAILLTGAVSLISVNWENSQKRAVGKVLSSSDESESNGGSSGSSGSGSSDKFKIESRTQDSRTKIETKEGKTKIEVRNEEGRFVTKVEEGKERTKIRTGDLRIEIKKEGDRVVVKIKNKLDEEVELEDEDEEELLDEVEDELDGKGIHFATGSAQLGFIQHGRKVRTNFPLSVNPATGELFVTTPSGEKVVTTLPDVAIGNMIRAGILTRVEQEVVPLPSPPPGESTPSATVEGAGIELTEVDNQPVFIISGVRAENFLGFVPVDLKLKVTVSAVDGQLVDIEQGFLGRLIDLLSF